MLARICIARCMYDGGSIRNCHVRCHGFSAASAPPALARPGALAPLVFILLHVPSLLSIVNILVQPLSISLCALYS